MRPIEIVVERQGRVVEHEFCTSPVQIGRHPGADLRLSDELVSSWHALIRFDEGRASFFDLGSTNGTVVHGCGVVPGQVVTFDIEPLCVQIGESALSLSRPSLLQTDAESVAGAIETATLGGSGDPQTSLSLTEIATLLPFGEAPKTSAAARDLLRRVARVLEGGARGLLELQQEQERVSSELGVRAVKANTGLRFARSSEQLLSLLLTEPALHERRLDELSMAFSDLTSHQIATINGVVAGARALLGELEPAAIERAAKLGPLSRFRGYWKTLITRWDALATKDETLLDILFGPEFARVYAEVGGEIGRRELPG